MEVMMSVVVEVGVGVEGKVQLYDVSPNPTVSSKVMPSG